MDDIRIVKLILDEHDLEQLGIWPDYVTLRSQLCKAAERKDCLLVQGAAFVVGGKAFLILGVGGIDFLDSLMQLDEVDGIIGNGNALFVSRDFSTIYSAHTTEELVKCYELEGFQHKLKFLESAPLGPAIFLLRSFKTRQEYDAAKQKVGKPVFETANTFSGKPIRYGGSSKARLRTKFLATVRVVHCARRPTLMKKECLFDSCDAIREAVDRFKGHFCLIYTLWNQVLCDAIGMRKTRELAGGRNPTDPITPNLVKLAKTSVMKHA